jgi:hypothetical protein
MVHKGESFVEQGGGEEDETRRFFWRKVRGA